MGLAVAAVANAQAPLTVTKELTYPEMWQVPGMGDGDAVIEVGEKWCFKLRITVTNNTSSTIEDVVVTDMFGAELEMVEVSGDTVPSPDYLGPWPDKMKPVWTNPDPWPDVTILWAGKSRKAHLTWIVGDVEPITVIWPSILTVTVCTDKNPVGEQEYTSPGCYCLNSGATAKGFLDGYQVSAGSGPLCGISVVEAVDFSVSPTDHDFGSVYLRCKPTAKTFTISNTGTAELEMGTLSITGTDTSEFFIQNDNCSAQTIAPSGTCTVQAVFSPTSAGSKSANLSILSNDPDTPTLDIPLTGEGVTAPSPVGGIAVPISKLTLLAPWIALVSINDGWYFLSSNMEEKREPLKALS